MSSSFLAAAAARARDAESLRYVWRGVNIGMIVDTVPYGCAMGQIKPRGKLQKDVPFTVEELRETAVGAMGVPKLYGRTARGWVDLTTNCCEILNKAAIVIDIDRDATRIGEASNNFCTIGPAIDLASEPSTWVASADRTIRELAARAGLAPLAGRHFLLTESIAQHNGPRQSRERWVSLCFESLSAASVYMAPRPPLMLYLLGKTSGIVVDGEDAVPIYEGCVLPHAVRRLSGKSANDIASAVKAAVVALDADLKRPGELLENVVICEHGAPSAFEGLVADVQTALQEFADAHTGPSVPGHRVAIVRACAAPHGSAAAWFGGALLAKLDPGTGMWIRRSEFDEEGAAIVHRKCLS